MSLAAQFAGEPLIGAQRISTANPNRDGTGTIATLVSAGLSGCRIDSVSIKAVGSTSQGMIRFFLLNSGTYRFLTEDQVDPVTASGVDKTHESYIEFGGGLILETGWSLCVSTEVADTFDVIAFGGDF